MAEAYPALDLKNNSTPGSGSGPMGGPGPFAPGNTPIVYARGSDPVQAFMANLSAAGVAGINSEGIPVGSTGGTTFMWSDQVKAANEAAGGDVMGSMGRMNNQFLQPRQAQQPAPMAGNAFLNPTTDVRVNGLTPAAPGGTPLLGRDYGSVNAAPGASGASSSLPPTPLSTFGQRLLATGGTETRDGAVFSGTGGKLSITQDPSTVPARGAGPSNLSPGAMAIITRGVNDFKGDGATNQFLNALNSGAYDEKPMADASPEQIAALGLRNQQLRQEATGAIPRLMLPNTGNPGVDAQRMNSFLPMAGGALGNVNDMASRAVRNQPEVVTLGGVQYARLGNSMNPIPDRNAPQNTLPDGTQRTLEPKDGLKIEAELIGNRWVDRKTGVPVYITDPITGQNAINPVLTGDENDPLDNPDGKGAAKPKKELSDIDKQAIAWAEKNPNDPRAAQIKKRLGL